MQHIDDGLIHAWLDGALDATERARVNQHIAHCPGCQGRIDEEREIIARASAILAAAVPPAFEAPPLPVVRTDRLRRRNMLSNPMRLAWAASIMLAVGFGWLGRSWLATEMTSEASIETFRTAEPAVQTDAAPPSAGPAASLAAPVEVPAAPLEAPAATQSAPARSPALRSAAPVVSPVAPVVTPPVLASRIAPESIQRQETAAAATGVRAQTFAANEWVDITAEAAARESGMPLMRLDGAEIVDVAIRRTIGRVELRTRQRLAADTTVVELVQMRELAIALSELVVTGAVAEDMNRVQQDSARTADTRRESANVRGDSADARRDSADVQAERARREAAAAQRSAAPAAKAVTPAINEVTAARDGIVVTARGWLSADSLRALLQRIK